MNISKDKAFDKILRLFKNTFIKKLVKSMARSSECGAKIEEAQGWRCVSISWATAEVVHSLFWRHANGSIKRKDGFEIWNKTFYELNVFVPFFVACTGKWPRIVDGEKNYNVHRTSWICLSVFW